MEKVRLGDVCILKTGKTPPTKETKYFDGQINWFTPGDLGLNLNLGDSNRTISNLAFEENKAIKFESGTLLMTCIGEIGKLGITTELSSSNQQITGLFPKDNLDVKYLFYVVFNGKKELQNLANNAVVPILNNRQLGEYKIPLPSLEVQKAIAAKLDKAQEIIRYTEEIIANYDTLTQSLFIDMFGDPVKNEKGWEKGVIRDLCEEVKYGTSAKADEVGQYPYLRMNNITYEGYMSYTNLKYINVSLNDFEKYSVTKGDILFNRTNSKELVGKTGLIRDERVYIIAGYLIRVRVNSLANSYYLWAFLNSKWTKSTLQNMCKNIVGMANINAQELQNISIQIPPIALQNQFAERVAIIEAQKQQAQESLAKSQDLFNSLLQESFKN